MKNRILKPLSWPKLVTHALLIGVVASGCAAGGGLGEDEVGDDSSSAPGASAPSSRPPAIAPAPTDTASSPSDSSEATAAGDDVSPSDTPASELLPDPELDEVAPPVDPGDDSNDDDRDDDDRDDDDRDDDDDDDRDDDDRDDDDDDRDDDDDDDDDRDDDAGVTPPVQPDPNNPNVLTFTADIRPILVTNCGRCHASGGLPNFASANAALGYDEAFDERDEIVSEIRRGSMPADTCNGPPGSNGCVSVADFNLIQQWVAAGAPE